MAGENTLASPPPQTIWLDAKDVWVAVVVVVVVVVVETSLIRV